MDTQLQGYARRGLEAELVRLDVERERVRTLLASLDGTTSKPQSRPPVSTRRGQMSDAGRQAIREAQKRRWARVRAAVQQEAGGQDEGSRTERGSAQRTSGAARTGNRKK